MLAIGSGSGVVDHDFLNEIVKVGKEVLGEEYSVVYQVVELNSDSIKYFRKSVLQIDSYSKITFQ